MGTRMRPPYAFQGEGGGGGGVSETPPDTEFLYNIYVTYRMPLIILDNKQSFKIPLVTLYIIHELEEHHEQIQ